MAGSICKELKSQKKLGKKVNLHWVGYCDEEYFVVGIKVAKATSFTSDKVNPNINAVFKKELEDLAKSFGLKAELRLYVSYG